MRIVIAGAGEIGSHLARMLSGDNHQIIIIDTDEERLQLLAASLDILIYHSSATSVKTLQEIFQTKTDLFIAVAHSEDTNITAAILAKRFGARKTIARISSIDYHNFDNSEFFKSLGVDLLISPELIAAREVLNLLQETGTTDYMEFAGGRLSMFVQKLTADSQITGHTLSEVAKIYDNIQFRVVAIKRVNKTIIPRGEEYFETGDTVFVFSTKEGSEVLMRAAGITSRAASNVMILGGSGVGRHVAKYIQNKCNVKLIVDDDALSEEYANELTNTLVINGDYRDVELLEQEGISQIDAFVSLTENSETNILSSLLAKHYGVGKTIAEVENMDYIHLAEGAGIDNVVNKKLSTASRIFRHTTSLNIMRVRYMSDANTEIIEFNVPSNAKITRGTLRSLNLPQGTLIAGGISGNIPFIATGNTIIKAGDRVVVFTLPEAYDRLSAFFS